MGPNTNIAGVGGYTFAAGRSGRSEKFRWERWDLACNRNRVNTLEKKIKAAVYLTNAKQGKSDIWKQFSIITENNWKELNLVSYHKCAKVFVYN